MRAIFLFLLLLNLGFSNDCVALFEARKEEIVKELEKIDTARQEFEAFRASSLAIFNARRDELNAREIDLNATLDKISKREKQIKDMLEENEKILTELRSMTTDKVAQAYDKMKDAPAAEVLTSLKRKEAAAIMYALSPKKISTIMAKMDPNIASEITTLLRIGPPFENNSTKFK